MSTIGDALAKKKQQLPQFEYLFRVSLPILDSNGMQGGSIEQNHQARFNGQYRMMQSPFDINHRVYSVDAPFVSFDTDKNTSADTFMYTARNKDIGTVSMRIDEYEDGLTLDYLLKWQSLMGDENGRNPPAVYKGNIKVIRATSTLADAHVHLYTGYFPTEISPISYSHESNGVMQYQVTFTGDDVVHRLVPASTIRQQAQGLQGMFGEMNMPGAGGNIFHTEIPGIGDIFNTIDRMSNLPNIPSGGNPFVGL